MANNFSTQTFLNDKFTPAKLPGIYAMRKNLMNVFNKAIKHRYVYVTAPAGSGKTISTLLWLEKTEHKPVWIGLDEYDNTPSVFYKLLATGIFSIQPDNINIKNILTSPSFSSSPVEHVVSILSEFLPTEQAYSFVFDDIHHMKDQEIKKSLLAVLKRMPHTFSVIFLSRNEICEELTGFINEESIITAKSLMFSEDEIQEYFNTLGKPISTDESQIAFLATGGMPIAINALAKSEHFNMKRTDYALETYIKEHLWQSWDESLRTFMLKTCIADEMTAELALRLSGDENSEEILKTLCSENSFITKTGNTYKYHHLFLNFLRTSAEQSDIDFTFLNKTTAEYYIEKGDYLTSRRYAIKSGDTEAIMRIIYEFSQYSNPSLDEYVKFSNVFNKDILPERICETYPFLYTAHVYLYYLSGNSKMMEYYLDKLYNHLPIIAEKYPQFMEMVILEISLDYRIPFSKQIEQFSSLPPINIESKTLQGASISTQLPFLHRSSRDYYELTDEALLDKLKVSFGMLLKNNYEMLISCVLSGLHLEKNRPETALQHALHSVSLINEETATELKYAILLQLASIYYSIGDYSKYSEFMQSAKDAIEKSGQHYLMHNYKAYETKIRLWESDTYAATQWLDNYFVTDTGNCELYKIYQHFATARAYIVLNKTEKAMKVILMLQKLAEDFRRPTDIAEAGVLKAAVEWVLGRHKAATQTMMSVLLKTQEIGFILVIANEGAAVMPILKRIASAVERSDYTGGLSSEYFAEVLLATYKTSKTRTGITVSIIKSKKPIRLSKQQRMILDLLHRGHRSTAIAGMTGLAVSTIKNHTSILYRKLGVNNALDAVLRAKEMELI